MDFLANDTFPGEVLPVLLGAGRSTRKISLHFFKKFGAISHVFCHRVPPTFHLSLFMKIHRVKSTHNDELLLQALCDFAKQYEGRDILLCLFACNEETAHFVSLHRKELEPFYLFLDRRAILRLCGREGVPA